MNSLFKNLLPILPMHFQTSTGNSSFPTALPFFIFLSAFFTFSLLMQFTSFLTTSASSVLGSLLFFTFISFSKHSFHLVSSASEFTITLPFSSFITPTCWKSFPALSLRLAKLCNFFPPFFVQKIFTLDALPAATLPIYPSLGPAPRHTGICLLWLGFHLNN